MVLNSKVAKKSIQKILKRYGDKMAKEKKRNRNGNKIDGGESSPSQTSEMPSPRLPPRQRKRNETMNKKLVRRDSHTSSIKGSVQDIYELVAKKMMTAPAEKTN